MKNKERFIEKRIHKDLKKIYKKYEDLPKNIFIQVFEYELNNKVKNKKKELYQIIMDMNKNIQTMTKYRDVLMKKIEQDKRISNLNKELKIKELKLHDEEVELTLINDVINNSRKTMKKFIKDYKNEYKGDNE